MIALLAAAGCSGDAADPAFRTAPPRDEGVVVVASFNFPESRLLAEIYAAALEGAGFRARVEADLGPRELVAPALQQGHVDVVPEYLGTALNALVGEAAAPSTEALADAFRRHGVRVLSPAPAQNQNALVVTKGTAARLRVEEISDLQPHAASMALGGPPECPTRRHCGVGLADVYGLRFRQFTPLAGASQARRALEDGVVDAAVMFTTDGHLAGGDLVVLADDRRLQPPENVVPVVREATLARHGERVAATLDRVSARLTTTALRLLNWRVSVAGRDPRAEAHAWLVRQDLLPR